MYCSRRLARAPLACPLARYSLPRGGPGAARNISGGRQATGPSNRPSFFCARIDDLGRYEVSLAHRRETAGHHLVEADLRANRPGRTPAMGLVHEAYENPVPVSIATDRDADAPRGAPVGGLQQLKLPECELAHTCVPKTSTDSIWVMAEGGDGCQRRPAYLQILQSRTRLQTHGRNSILSIE